MESWIPVLDTPDKTTSGRGRTRARGGRPSEPRSSDPHGQREPIAPRRSVAARLRRNGSATGAVVLLLLLVGMAVLGPVLLPANGDAVDFSMQLQPPSVSHPFGTDDLGRDLLVRVAEGGRVTLAVGALAMVLALMIGGAVGAVAGYAGGWVDSMLMRFTDLVLAIPMFLIILFVSSVLTPSVLLLCLLIGATQWMEVARVVRAVVRSTRENEFVEAARALGAGDARILVRHVLTHTLGPAGVSATLALAQAMMMESAVSFLGFGSQPPAASWGTMLHTAQNLVGTAPWTALFPGLMIFLTVLCCYVLADFLRSTIARNTAGSTL
jgi:peptide/nickel transport system permease protein